jgi:hypothetical protein
VATLLRPRHRPERGAGKKRFFESDKPDSVTRRSGGRSFIYATHPGVSDGPPTPLFRLAPEGVYPAPDRRRPGGELLPHPFTLTFRNRSSKGGLLSVALAVKGGCRRPRLRFHGATCPVVSGLSSRRRSDERTPALKKPWTRSHVRAPPASAQSLPCGDGPGLSPRHPFSARRATGGRPAGGRWRAARRGSRHGPCAGGCGERRADRPATSEPSEGRVPRVARRQPRAAGGHR